MTHLSVPLLRSIAGVRPAHVRRQFRGYVDRLRWVALDGLRHFRGRVLWIVVCNFIGLATAASSLGGIVLYAKHAEGGKPVHVLGHKLQFDGGLKFLILYGASVALLGVLSGASLYYTEWLVQRTTRQYEEVCTQRLLTIIGGSIYRGWQDLVEAPIRASLARLLGMGARWTAFAFRDMLHGILPVLTFGFAAAVLVRTDVWLTLMLIPAAGLYLIPLYLINRGVARHQSAYRRHSCEVRSDLSSGTRRVLESNQPPDLKAQWSDRVIDQPQYRNMLDAFYGRMIADKRVQFLNTSFFVFCLFALFMFFGVMVKMYDRPWSQMLTYLFALRYAVNSLRQVSGMFVKFSKFLPEFRAYTEMVDGAERIRRRRERRMAKGVSLPESLTLRLSDERRWNSHARVSVRPGEMLWAFIPGRATQFELEALAVRLGAKIEGAPDLVLHGAFFAGASLDPERSLRVNALGESHEPDEAAQLRDVLERLCVWTEIQQLTNGLEALGAAAQEQPLSNHAAYAISAGRHLINESGIAFVSFDALQSLKPEFTLRLMDEIAARARYVVMVDHRPDLALQAPQPALENVGGVIVMDGRSPIAGGDLPWLRDNLKQIKRFLQLRRDDIMNDDEDLDEDEDTDSME